MSSFLSEEVYMRFVQPVCGVVKDVSMRVSARG